MTFATLAALAFCLLIVAFGVLGLVSPGRIVDLARRFVTPGGLCFATAVRILMGLTFVFAAPASRAPGVISVLGVVVVVAGVAIPFIGLERIRGLLDWWSARGEVLIRGQATFALVFGLGLAYVLLPA